jgi:hypothetical protein
MNTLEHDVIRGEQAGHDNVNVEKGEVHSRDAG